MQVVVTETTTVEVPETYVATTTVNGYVESYVVTTYVSEVESRTVPGTEEPIVTTYVTEVPVTKTETYTIPPQPQMEPQKLRQRSSPLSSLRLLPAPS
jgi:hypothetical protein